MEAARDLEKEVSAFVENLVATFEGALGGTHDFETLVGPPGDSQRVTVVQKDDDGIPLTVNGRVVLRLQVRYRCMWNSDANFFAINESAFTISVVGAPEPLMHFDYNREGPGDIPVAHLNLHAHRDELMYVLMLASGHRAKNRDAAMKKGKIPRLSALHIPLGGHRFRPAIEDVLDMLVVEFGIDCSKDARKVLAEGRARFRSIQVSAAVSDDPGMAADALRRLGYTITAPDPEPETKKWRLERF